MIRVRKRICSLCLAPWPTWVVYDDGGLYFCSFNWRIAYDRAVEIAAAKQPGTGDQVHQREKVINA